ncbi:MAG: ribulokinase [Terriglobales bacterium]
MPTRRADRFVLGLDFGTESGRAIVVRVRDGAELGAAVAPYAHGVLTRRVPGGPALGPDWALQDADDYLRATAEAAPRALRAAGVKGEQVIGIGTAFTASSPMPARADGTPLSRLRPWRREPHAYVKLWKHHAAQPQADRINQLGRERHEAFLATYGGRYSAEWFWSKLLQVAEESPRAYAAIERWIEAADWIVWQLTGNERRATCTAGYKAMWQQAAAAAPDGAGALGGQFPAAAFFRALDPQLSGAVGRLLPERYFPLGARAGGLTAAWAKRLGVPAGIAVAVGNVDAHGAVPACGVTGAEKMVMVMGTSICHLLLGRERRPVEGMCGVVRDGVVPGLWGYEAGQSAVGDIFGWFFATGVPEAVSRQARKEKRTPAAWLERAAGRLRPGESGLLALDWWNGNRSILVDTDLSGLLVGLTLATRPEEIYRALLESTAFGTRQIIEAFEAQGVPVRELYACGGLPERNPLLMQIYADVTGRPIRVPRSPQTCSALGAALHAAVAAGPGVGGHADIFAAARAMSHLRPKAFQPRAAANTAYNQLFREYQTLHDYFGRGGNAVMKRLRAQRHSHPEPADAPSPAQRAAV